MRLRADQKLFLSYLAVIATVVAALTLGVGNTLRDHLVRLVADDLGRELRLSAALAATRPGLAADSVADWLGAVSGRRVTLVAADGTVLGDSELDGPALAAMDNHRDRPEVAAARAGGAGEDVRLSSSVGTEHLYVAARLRDGRVLRLAVPLRDVDDAVGRARSAVFGVGIVALGLTALLSLAFSIAVTRPLRRLVAVAQAMARGDLSRRARRPRGHRDELRDLADALDTLASELQRRLGQLEGERAETQVLFDSMAEAVIAVGPDGSVRRTNDAARRIFDLPADARGLAPEAVARRSGFLELVRAVMEGNPVPPTEISDGDRHLLGTAQPLPGGGAVTVFLDVSALRRLEDVRRDFVANASHELKTPLTAIRGFSETLLDDELPAPLRRQFAQTVKDNADRLQRIIDDLLDLSRIESGGYRVHPAILSVPETAADAWKPLAAEAEGKGVRLTLRVPPECEFVLADPSALRQVFTNLFTNALRYVPTGGTVQVGARCVAGPAPAPAAGGAGAVPAPPAGSPAGWIAIAVRDNGSGIPAAHLPRIFERFYRADAARARAEGGTGLGLAIVRHLVERHGGTVVAESQLGRGTTVRFTLPAPDEGDGREGAFTDGG